MNHGIIIPCYNEEKRIDTKAFVDFAKANKDYTLCFVNDGSKDETLSVLNNMKNQATDNILVYDMPANGGKAEAVRNGVQYLAANAKVQTIGFIDADLSTSFEDYVSLLGHMEEDMLRKKMIFGSRKAEEQEGVSRSFFRSLASNTIGLFIKAILQLPIKDTQCGAKVFSTDAATHAFKDPFITRWLFDVEIFMRMKMKFGKSIMNRIKEVPLTGWTEVEGSHITIMDSFKMPAQLGKIFLSYRVQPAITSVPKRIGHAGYKLMASLNLL